MPTGPLPDKWFTRDFPVLIEVTHRFDDGAAQVAADELPEALGMAETEVQAALKALARRSLIDVIQSHSMGGPQPVIAVLDVSGEAYVVTGLHPNGDDDLSALIDVFRQAAERTDDPGEKSRLRAVVDALLGASGDVVKLTLAAYIAARVPG